MSAVLQRQRFGRGSFTTYCQLTIGRKTISASCP